MNKIVEYENKRGLRAWWTGMHTKLPDIIVFDEDYRLVRVYESTNYKTPEMYVNRERAQRYLTTLIKFNCERIVVVSFESNLLDGKEYFEKHGIKVVVMGYQD
ncbi:hypothetical protein ACFLXC_04060 [Chloroflexota bacterium]